jgi:hypothetical protein
VHDIPIKAAQAQILVSVFIVSPVVLAFRGFFKTQHLV